MNGPAAGARGHRSVPHTADTRIEAWAPTRDGCIAEAVTGLVASFADTSSIDAGGARPVRTAVVDLTVGSDADALVEALDEVVYLLDTQGAVPVEADVAPGPRLRLHLVPVTDVVITGAAPKAVTLHELRLDRVDGGWFCAVTIDV
jgi:SHS2 domain-containing protein